MKNSTEEKYVRVSYRFKKSTVDALDRAQKGNNVEYANRPIVWLIENAVESLYSNIEEREPAA